MPRGTECVLPDVSGSAAEDRGVVLAASEGTDAAAAKRVALVIGNSSYTAVTALPNPDPFLSMAARVAEMSSAELTLAILTEHRPQVAAYSDEMHVEENRRLYRIKFDLADQIIGDRYGHVRPAGGFFLWLDMAAHGGGEEAVKTLWKGCGVRVLPGAYLAQAEPDGVNPGTDYIRVALVHNADVTREALTRIVATLG